MRILIELPSWLGDGVMASAAVENLCANFDNAKIVFFGSFASVNLYENHPNCEKIVIDESRKSKFRLLNLIKSAKNLGKFDIAVSFRSHFASRVFLKFANAGRKFIFKNNGEKIHQVQKYLNFVNSALNLQNLKQDQKLYFEKKSLLNSQKKLLGLNPGATYGSAKRWYPAYFAEVATALKDKFDIVIFGGVGEKEICDEIEQILRQNGVVCVNLCGKTSIKELCENIANLDLFITNDSGPMHIAAAFKIPSVAVFGPTRFDETSPYGNKNAKIVHLNLPCMPCMKRICPLKTHECMKNLTPKMLLEAINSLNLNA